MVSSLRSVQSRNFDRLRFDVPPGRKRTLRKVLKAAIVQLIQPHGLSYLGHVSPERLQAGWTFLSCRLAFLWKSFELFEDTQSRELFVQLLLYRLLGEKYVKLPMNNGKYWQLVERLESGWLRPRAADLKTSPQAVQLYELNELAFPISLAARASMVLATFLLEQYAYRIGGYSISASPGDLVIDAGACWGDTALYFAHKVGRSGKVIAFEFDSENLRLLENNLVVNPELRDRITVVQQPLWDEPGVPMSATGSGPGTGVGMATESTAVTRSETIDEWVQKNNARRVGFIKLDVERAELRCLRGAEKTLRRDTPALAVCVYHKPEDLYEIPLYLNSLNLGYRFHLGHFTIHSEETVLFAVSP